MEYKIVRLNWWRTTLVLVRRSCVRGNANIYRTTHVLIKKLQIDQVSKTIKNTDSDTSNTVRNARMISVFMTRDIGALIQRRRR